MLRPTFGQRGQNPLDAVPTTANGQSYFRDPAPVHLASPIVLVDHDRERSIRRQVVGDGPEHAAALSATRCVNQEMKPFVAFALTEGQQRGGGRRGSRKRSARQGHRHGNTHELGLHRIT
jgi:hypothetical protein